MSLLIQAEGLMGSPLVIWWGLGFPAPVTQHSDKQKMDRCFVLFFLDLKFMMLFVMNFQTLCMRHTFQLHTIHFSDGNLSDFSNRF